MCRVCGTDRAGGNQYACSGATEMTLAARPKEEACGS